MRFHRLSKLLLTLLLAASLPLRVYAAVGPCEPPMAHADRTAQAHADHTAQAHPDRTAEAPAHHGTHCEHGSASGHGAACDCCCVGVAAAPPNWTLPPDLAATACARLLRHSPILTLDRLDRPPRLSA
jgi:hypothetical protein